MRSEGCCSLRRITTGIDFEVGGTGAVAEAGQRHQRVGFRVVGRQVATRNVVTHQLEPVHFAHHAVVPQGFYLYPFAVLQAQRRQILRMDEQHFTLTVNAAVAVIQTIDGGVVLIVRAQRLQG